jgi:hypothetical protein
MKKGKKKNIKYKIIKKNISQLIENKKKKKKKKNP